MKQSFAQVCRDARSGVFAYYQYAPKSAAVNVSHDEVIHAAAIGAPRVAAFIMQRVGWREGANITVGQRW